MLDETRGQPADGLAALQSPQVDSTRGGLQLYRLTLSDGTDVRFSESEQVKAAQKLGAGSYLKKPYLLETLGKAVRSELN